MGVSALKWQGWLVALVFVAGLLVFAPLGLYVWAGGRPAARSAEAAPDDVRITGCRIDPTSRRVVASVEAVNGFPEQGAYVVTVEFREQPPAARDGSAGPAARPGSRNGSAGPAAPGSPNGAGPAVRPGSPDGGRGPRCLVPRTCGGRRRLRGSRVCRLPGRSGARSSARSGPRQ